MNKSTVYIAGFLAFVVASIPSLLQAQLTYTVKHNNVVDLVYQLERDLAALATIPTADLTTYLNSFVAEGTIDESHTPTQVRINYQDADAVGFSWGANASDNYRIGFFNLRSGEQLQLEVDQPSHDFGVADDLYLFVFQPASTIPDQDEVIWIPPTIIILDKVIAIASNEDTDCSCKYSVFTSFDGMDDTTLDEYDHFEIHFVHIEDMDTSLGSVRFNAVVGDDTGPDFYYNPYCDPATVLSGGIELPLQFMDQEIPMGIIGTQYEGSPVIGLDAYPNYVAQLVLCSNKGNNQNNSPFSKRRIVELQVRVIANEIHAEATAQVAGDYQWGLYDTTGRILQQQKRETAIGELQHTFDGTTLPSGWYMVVLEGPTGRSVQRVVKSW